jgi:hypothetical protein
MSSNTQDEAAKTEVVENLKKMLADLQEHRSGIEKEKEKEGRVRALHELEVAKIFSEFLKEISNKNATEVNYLFKSVLVKYLLEEIKKKSGEEANEEIEKELNEFLGDDNALYTDWFNEKVLPKTNNALDGEAPAAALTFLDVIKETGRAFIKLEDLNYDDGIDWDTYGDKNDKLKFGEKKSRQHNIKMQIITQHLRVIKKNGVELSEADMHAIQDFVNGAQYEIDSFTDKLKEFLLKTLEKNVTAEKLEVLQAEFDKIGPECKEMQKEYDETMAKDLAKRLSYKEKVYGESDMLSRLSTLAKNPTSFIAPISLICGLLPFGQLILMFYTLNTVFLEGDEGKVISSKKRKKRLEAPVKISEQSNKNKKNDIAENPHLHPASSKQDSDIAENPHLRPAPSKQDMLSHSKSSVSSILDVSVSPEEEVPSHPGSGGNGGSISSSSSPPSVPSGNKTPSKDQNGASNKPPAVHHLSNSSAVTPPPLAPTDVPIPKGLITPLGGGGEVTSNSKPLRSIKKGRKRG